MIKTKIRIIIVADSAPVLPNSNVDAKALGISATIPEKIIKEMMSSDYENLLQVFDSNFGSFVILER